MANAVVDRAQAVELQLDSVHVVVADVLVGSGLQRVEAGELREVEELRFQGSEEALHRRVVKAVSRWTTTANIGGPLTVRTLSSARRLSASQTWQFSTRSPSA